MPTVQNSDYLSPGEVVRRGATKSNEAEETIFGIVERRGTTDLSIHQNK